MELLTKATAEYIDRNDKEIKTINLEIRQLNSKYEEIYGKLRVLNDSMINISNELTIAKKILNTIPSDTLLKTLECLQQGSVKMIVYDTIFHSLEKEKIENIEIGMHDIIEVQDQHRKLFFRLRDTFPYLFTSDDIRYLNEFMLPDTTLKTDNIDSLVY